jgi:hypothetical protein
MKRQYKKNDIFSELKGSLIGRIDDNDIDIIKEGFVRLYKSIKYKFPYRFGKSKIIYYRFSKPESDENNQQWLRIKTAIDSSQAYVFGSNDAYYINKGQPIKYYKYFRYYTKYHILELVSDYYNKIPIFYHFTSDGVYDKHNGIEYIKDIDY